MDEKRIQILLVEQNSWDAHLIELFLGETLKMPYSVGTVGTLASASRRLAAGGVHLVLLDLDLPDSFGIVTFLRLQSQAPDVPIVVLSNIENTALAVSAVHQGAHDYIVRGRFDGESLARSIQFAVERTRRLHAEQELSAAEELQRRLFPAAGPELAGFDISGAVYPAERTSGDYFDFLRMSDGTIDVVVGDVSGHGLGPALMMVETRAYLRALSETCLDVGEILTQVNRLLSCDHTQHFVSLFQARLEPQTRSFVYASAGHAGYLLDASGEWRLLDSTGLVLGLLEEASISSAPAVPFHPGDLLFVPTDGFQESLSPGGELFGMTRTLEVVRACRREPARKIISELQQAAREFARGAPQRDDMAAVIVKFNQAV